MTFPASLTLASLPADAGATLVRGPAGSILGGSLTGLGDINGDGLTDFFVGALAPEGGVDVAGYVVFGRTTGLPTSLDLSTLDGSNGFRITAPAGSKAGVSAASAGDLNGDGLADLVIGAALADPSAGSDAGSAFVIYGRSSGFAATVDLASLGAAGLRLNGGTTGQRLGSSTAGGHDLNGDGRSDLVVGGVDGAWVVFGAAGLSGDLSAGALNGVNGVRLTGLSGDVQHVASLGDINGDGVGDFALAAATTVYVIHGGTGLNTATLSLSSLNGSTGYRVQVGDTVTSLSAAGDLNGDGLNDVMFGARDGNSLDGYAVVLYGARSRQGSADVAGHIGTATGGLYIGALLADEGIGASLASAGDVNTDGRPDLLIGNRHGDAYLLLSRPGGWPLNTAIGLYDPRVALDGTGGDVAALAPLGDVNNDWIDDFGYALESASPDGPGSGAAYVVYGRPGSAPLFFRDGAGAAQRSGGLADDTLLGGGGNDRLAGSGGQDLIWGEAGRDSLRGGAGNDELSGGADADTLDGGEGDDRLEAGGGDDYALGEAGFDTLNGGAGADMLYGGAGTDLLEGGDGDDNLLGDADSDTLIGGLGADVLDGGFGADLMAGGEGADVYFVDNDSDRVSDVGTTGSDTLYLTTYSLDLSLSLGVELVFGLRTDGHTILGSARSELIEAGAGNDLLDGAGGDDTVNGGTGANTLRGGEGNDRLSGDGVLDGGGGADSMTGGAGDTTFVVDSAGDRVLSDAGGVDTVLAWADFTAAAGIENIQLMGSARSANGSTDDNTFTGSDGNDRLNPSWGDDTLHGGAGDDTLVAGAGDDVLYGGEGLDYLEILGAAVTVDLALETQTVAHYGLETLDSVEGVISAPGSWSDDLRGSAAANRFVSRGGEDILQGRGGDDTLEAGDGLDTAVYDALPTFMGFEGGGLRVDAGAEGQDLLLGVEWVRVGGVHHAQLQGDDAYDGPANLPVSLDLLANDIDLDGDAFRLQSVTIGGIDHAVAATGDTLIDLPGVGLLTLNAAGKGVFTAAANADLDLSFTYTTGDADGTARHAVVTLDLAKDDAAPVITFAGGGPGAAARVVEGASAVAALTALDPDGDPISFSIVAPAQGGAADGALFAVDPLTGALSFLSAPDFEAPADADGDNVYLVTVQVSDGSASDAQVVAVSVDDLFRFVGTGAFDALTADNGADTVAGLGGDDRLDGEAGDDRVAGGAGADTAEGGAGSDVLRGDGGDDRLIGGAGFDRLLGGEGADVFVFDQAPGRADWDRIVDWAAGDRIELDANMFTGLPAGSLDAAAFHLGRTAQTAEHRILYDPGAGLLRYDADGAGGAAAIEIAVLAGAPALTAADIWVA